MSPKDIFFEEENILKAASQLIEDGRFDGTPLYDDYSELLKSFARLLRQHKRIISLSDKQQLKMNLLIEEMKNILDNIPVGILTIDESGIVSPAYSLHMHTLFGKETSLAGMKIADIIYWEEDREKDRTTFTKWLKLVFDISHDWDLIGGLGPDLVEHDTENGTLFYRNSFHRIIHDNEVSYLMIYITDISEKIRQKKALEEQASVHNFELEVFSIILNQEDSNETTDFIYESEKMLAYCSKLLSGLHTITDKLPVYNDMFRQMHSIKGLSKVYGMNELARFAHQAEEILNQFRDNEISFESGLYDGELASEKLDEILGKMKLLLSRAEKILQKMFNKGKETAAAIRSRRRELKVDSERIEALAAFCDCLETGEGVSSEFAGQIDELKKKVKGLVLQPLDVVYARLRRIVTDISGALNKEVDISMEGDRVLLTPGTHHLIISSLIHLLRNSLDHGLETPEERTAYGKHPAGKISVKTSVAGNAVTILFEDDGAGIDPDSTAEKAISKGLVTREMIHAMTWEEKIRLILLPGFSSKDSVSDISGRGVGMDVVFDSLLQLGGTLDIKSEPKKGVAFLLSFPVNV